MVRPGKDPRLSRTSRHHERNHRSHRERRELVSSGRRWGGWRNSSRGRSVDPEGVSRNCGGNRAVACRESRAYDRRAAGSKIRDPHCWADLRPQLQVEAETLASCYRESIRLAEDHGIRSLAFPSISTGAFGYPVHEAAGVAVLATVRGPRFGKSSYAGPLRVVRWRYFEHLRTPLLKSCTDPVPYLPTNVERTTL